MLYLLLGFFREEILSHFFKRFLQLLRFFIGYFRYLNIHSELPKDNFDSDSGLVFTCWFDAIFYFGFLVICPNFLLNPSKSNVIEDFESPEEW